MALTPLLQFSLLWARVAFGLFAAGMAAALASALVADPRRQAAALGTTRATVEAGFLFELVSLAEGFSIARGTPLSYYRLITSVLATGVAVFFLMVYRAHSRDGGPRTRGGIAGSPRALSLLVVPLICVLAGISAFGPVTRAATAESSPLATHLLQNGWIYVHIVMISLGYAGLLVAMAASVMYLFAQHRLKAKQKPTRPLPPLETLDLVAYQALLAGFPLLTAGLVIGAYWADRLFGGISFRDPTVVLALLVWAVYLVLLFARWSAGWRGRRTAFLTLVCFGLALSGWLANGLSHMHSIFLH